MVENFLFVRRFENDTFESVFFKGVEIESVVVSAHPHYTVAQIWGKSAPLKLCKELTTKEKYFKTHIFFNIGLIEFSVLSIISKP